jgi:hypothetical protein
VAPLEDDALFRPQRDRPTKLESGQRVPYHQMSAEERRAAWAAVRARQRRRARGHRRAPLLWGGSSAASFATGGVLLHFQDPLGLVFLWAGVALLAFAVIAVGRNALGKLSGAKDDTAPPGF